MNLTTINPSLSRRRRRPGSQKGFSLIEIMIAMAITLVALTGLMALYVSLLKGNDNASRATEASAFAKETLEEVRSTSFTTLTGLYGSTPVDTAATMPTRTGRAGQDFETRLLITDVPAEPELVVIRVEISWTDSGAVPGSANGRYDHLIAIELVRWRSDVL